MERDADLFAFLETRNCLVPSPASGSDVAPTDLDVRLVRGGPAFNDSVSFVVILANRGAKPISLDLRVRDQRLCFELDGGGFPSPTCMLLATAPEQGESRVRVLLLPRVMARVEGLVFIQHTAIERATKDGAVGMFDEPLPSGPHDATVHVPLAWASVPPRVVLLHTTVVVP